MGIKTCEEYLINELEQLKQKNEALLTEISFLTKEKVDNEPTIDGYVSKEELVDFILECNFRKNRLEYDTREEMLEFNKNYYGLKNKGKLTELGIPIEQQKAFINAKYDAYEYNKVEESEEI